MKIERVYKIKGGGVTPKGPTVQRVKSYKRIIVKNKAQIKLEWKINRADK